MNNVTQWRVVRLSALHFLGGTAVERKIVVYPSGAMEGLPNIASMVCAFYGSRVTMEISTQPMDATAELVVSKLATIVLGNLLCVHPSVAIHIFSQDLNNVTMETSSTV